MQVRLLAFVIWAAVAASAVFWLLRLWSSSPMAPAHTVAVATTAPPRGDLTRVFGAPPAAAGPAAAPTQPALASRFKLLGVASPRDGSDRTGLALIAVDDKPARGFKVGAVIDGDLVLQSVHPRGAALGPSGSAPAVSLELPALPGAVSSPRPVVGGVVPMVPPPGAPAPGAGTLASMPTAAVPPPAVSAPPPGMLAPVTPEAPESAAPQPAAPPATTANTR
jgi:general secretion pathway protein C